MDRTLDKHHTFQNGVIELSNFPLSGKASSEIKQEYRRLADILYPLFGISPGQLYDRLESGPTEQDVATLEALLFIKRAGHMNQFIGMKIM